MSQGREAFNKIRETLRRINRPFKAVENMQEQMAIAARDGAVYMPSRMAQAPVAASPEYSFRADEYVAAKKKGGIIKSSASKRADGCAIRGKTKGRMV